MTSNIVEGKFSRDKLPQEHIERENKQSDMLQFSGKAHYCTVSVIDIVDSTKISATINPSKLGDFYSIFLNYVAEIVKSSGGIVVKNIGDSLLYYFGAQDKLNKSITDAFNCNLQIIEKRNKINAILAENKLPSISYRISSDFGKVFVAMSSISSIEDIFGPTVNMCAKINHVGESNRFFIGNDLFIHARSVLDFKFDEINSERCNVLKYDYPVYYVKKS